MSTPVQIIATVHTAFWLGDVETKQASLLQANHSLDADLLLSILFQRQGFADKYFT